MKNKVTVRNAQGEYLQHAVFESLETQESWIQMLKDTSIWGKAEHKVLVSPELQDEEGNITHEAVYETIPAEYTLEIEDISAEVEAQERLRSLIAQGELTSKACKDAFNLIAGYNQFRQMTSEQKNEMTTLFAPIIQALKIYERPSVAKALVTAIVPDGTLVTEQMKADMLEVLKDF